MFLESKHLLKSLELAPVLTLAGMGIRSLGFRANRSLFDKKERITFSLFLKAVFWIRVLFSGSGKNFFF